MKPTDSNFLMPFFLFSLGFLFASPCLHAQQEMRFVGTWKARWTLSVPPGENPERYAANGAVVLREDGKGTITVYGSKDSVMATETATNNITWSLDGDALHIMEQGETSGIRYTITAREENFLRLSLVDDIVLELTRQP